MKSAYEAEKLFGVSQSTLGWRLKGETKTSKEAHEDQQLLTKAEEEARVKMCSELTRGGYPARHNAIEEMAEAILSGRLATVNTYDSVLVTYHPMGIHWITLFVHQYKNIGTVVS